MRAIRRRLADDTGVTLIEVMVATALLAVVSVGVMSSLDVSARVSGDQKAKVVAANLAESRLEELRGLTLARIEEADGVTATRVIGGATYRVSTRAFWLADAGAPDDVCVNDVGTTAMKLEVTVSWGVDRSLRLDTLASPGVRSVGIQVGALVQRFSDSESKEPLAGVRVSLVSLEGKAAPAAQLSDERGCVVWTGVPAGAWTMKASKTGYLTADPSTVAGADPILRVELTRQINVISSETVFTAYELVPGGRISGDFFSISFLDGIRRASAPRSYVIAGGGDEALVLPLGTGLSGATSFTTPLLRGDAGEYRIYAGACVEGAPVRETPTAPETGLGDDVEVDDRYVATATAGQATRAQVRLPTYDVTTKSSLTANASMRVSFFGCGLAGTLQQYYDRYTVATTGRLTDPGFPFDPSLRRLCVVYYPNSTASFQLRTGGLKMNTDQTTQVRLNWPWPWTETTCGF